MSILEPSAAISEQNDETELNNLNNTSGELSEPKNTLDELTYSKVDVPIDEFKEEDQKVFEDENGHITRIIRNIYSQGVLYSQVDIALSNDSAGKIYATSITTNLLYSNGNIINSRSTSYSNEGDTTEVIKTYYIYHKDYTIANAHHHDKYNHLTKTVVEKEFHSGLSDTEVTSYNTDGQITEVIKESNDSAKHTDVIRFSYNENKHITEEVEECRINSLLKTKVKTKYAVLDSNTGETYKSSTITTSYGQKGAVIIKGEHFSENESKVVTINKTSYSNGQKHTKIASSHYNKNKHATKSLEEYHINDVLNRTVKIGYTVLDNNTGETYQSSIVVTRYGPEGKKKIYNIYSEYFDRQKNKIEVINQTNHSDGSIDFITESYFYNKDNQVTKKVKEHFVNGILNEKVMTKYTISNSDIGKTYQSTVISIKYDVNGKIIIKGEYFNENGNNVKKVDVLYINDKLDSLSESYFSDLGHCERKVYLNAKYDTNGNVSGYDMYEEKYNESGDIIDSDSNEYDVNAPKIVDFKSKGFDAVFNIKPGINSLIGAIDRFPAQESVSSSIDEHGPGMNSLIEAIGSFSAQESVFSSIDYHGQGNMLNTFVATTNQFEALQ